MSEEIKTELEGDEENLKTTPVRESMSDYQNNRQTDDEQDNEQPASGQDESTTTERLKRRKTQDTAGDEVTHDGNGDIEPVGRTTLFADNSTDINVTIGKLLVHVKPIANQNVNLDNRKINVTKEKIEYPVTLDNSCGEGYNKEINSPAETLNISKNSTQEGTESRPSVDTDTTDSETIQQEKNQCDPLNTDADKTSTKENTDSDKTPIKDKSTNSTSQETLQVQVKTEPEMDKNDAIESAETIARTASLETNTEIVSNAAPTEIPDILVKTEPNENNSNEPMDNEQTLAPPSNHQTEATPQPPSVTAPRIRDSDTDGISTPMISVAPMSRLRVKTELSLFQQPTSSNVETSSLPEDFFEDLLTVNNHTEPGEITANSGDDAEPPHEHIPDDFFDDLLRDKITEHIEEAINNDLEEKYSDLLKELNAMEHKKNHKKPKKSKKKSHKKSHSPSHILREKERDGHKRSPSPNLLKKKRSRLSSPPPSSTSQQLSSTSNYGNLNKVTTVDTASLMPDHVHGLQIKSEFRTDMPNENIINCNFNQDVEMTVTTVKIEPPPPPLVNCEEFKEAEEKLTPKQKIERAKQRASFLISHLKNMSTDTNSTLSTFQFTSIVRKLPVSHSYVHQHVYENRSPLHTVNNVNYKFNSHCTRFNMEEWGLAILPPQAAKVAKILGCDALTIHNKLKSIKIPAKLQKMKGESVNNQGEDLMETASSYFCNAMTQTDEMEELTQRTTKGYEIGIQVEPSICNVGCQTLETQSPTKNSQRDPDELPIMKIMRDLNENQLMAIHDFAELIKEPAGNAMDMYTLRMRMLEIYKCSQLPSALATPPARVINNYTTSSSRNTAQTHRRSAAAQQPIIQSVSGADGSHFSINDPRAKSAAYTSRIGGGGGGGGRGSSSLSTNYDSRYSAFTQPSGASSSSVSCNYSSSPPSSSRQRPSSNQSEPSTSAKPKYYGRGGLRRQ